MSHRTIDESDSPDTNEKKVARFPGSKK